MTLVAPPPPPATTSRPVAACDKLYSLLYSYNVREKFAGDFPEFAKYLPALAVKAKLPAVIVRDVRAELSKFGIPQK